MERQSNLRRDYLTDGFIVVKSIFTKEYISKKREEMINFSKNYPIKSEILLNQSIQELILNEKLIKIMKEILNTNSLLYFSDSGVVNHTDPFKNKTGFHNDARNEDEHIPYKKEYPIIRLGIYFENFKDFSGGLKIKKKSHKYFIFNFRRILADTLRLLKVLFTKTRYNMNSLKLGKSINLELEQGDVVIWNLRTHHCGTSRRLKLFPKICLQPFFEQILPRHLFLPTQYKQDRCALFATFAKNDLNSTNIFRYLQKKSNTEKMSQIKLNSGLMNKLNELKCKLPENF